VNVDISEPPVTSARTFRNPVVPGFHPDPSICRAWDDYYLVCSSFEYAPGVPIFHSRDLTRWRQLGNVLDRPSQLALAPDTVAPQGIYAPTIRYHGGRFYVITTNTTGHGSTKGHLIVTATDPAGPWSDPVHLDLPGVDPDLCWDDDGTCWCTVSGVRTATVDPDAGLVLDGPWPVWSGSGLQYPEAPHLYRIRGRWYLLVSEGGTHTGHAVSIASAPSPRGPFTPAPGNPLLTHSGKDLPVRATGHGDLVEAPDGTWWMVLLGIRQRGGWPSYHVLGRETFLTSVTWDGEWPSFGQVDLEMPAPAAAAPAEGCGPEGPRPPARFVGDPVRDDFDGDRLDPAWISPRWQLRGAHSLTERPGWLTLHATGATLDRPGATVAGRRQLHHDCRAAVLVDPGTARCGLTVRLDEAHHADLEVDGGRVRVIGRIGAVRGILGEAAVPSGPFTLAVEARTHDLTPAGVTSARDPDPGPTGLDAGGAPDLLSFRVESGAGTVVVAEMDGRHLSTEAASGFTGRVIGPYVTRGTAAFDWFEYTSGASDAGC
jgi:xylan 1,4-beta-xylosidase